MRISHLGQAAPVTPTAQPPKDDGMNWWPFILIGGGLYVVFAYRLAKSSASTFPTSYESALRRKMFYASPEASWMRESRESSRRAETTSAARERNRRATLL